MLAFTISLPQIQAFLLIFARVVTLLFTLPPFDSQSIPALFKIALAFSISLLLFPLVAVSGGDGAQYPLQFALSALMEALLGLIIGLSVNLVLSGIQMAGQLIGFQMGFAISTVFDPLTGTQVSVTAQFYYLMAILIFLAMDAHHLFIQAVADSFWLAPMFGAALEMSMFPFFIQLSANMFAMAIKVGAPVIAALVLSTFALGLIARIAPQMNVFFVAMPLQIIIGLLFIAVSLAYLTGFLESLWIEAAENMVRLLRLAG